MLSSYPYDTNYIQVPSFQSLDNALSNRLRDLVCNSTCSRILISSTMTTMDKNPECHNIIQSFYSCTHTLASWRSSYCEGIVCCCLSDVNECSGNPCNGGTCRNMIGMYMCECPSGQAGTNCETRK